MNDPLGLFEEDSNADPLGLFDQEKPKAGFGVAVKKALAMAGNAIDQGGWLPIGAAAKYAGFGDASDSIFRDMDQRVADRNKWANPENLETSLGQDALATGLTFPAQILAMPGQAAVKGMDLIQRGEPLSTAVPATLIDAGVNAASMGPMAPAKTFLGRAAIGAGANVAVGAGSDAATQLLATKDETKAAYNPYDPRRRLQEALVGGTLQGAMGERPKPTGNKKLDGIRADAAANKKPPPVEARPVPGSNAWQDAQLKLRAEMDAREMTGPANELSQLDLMDQPEQGRMVSPYEAVPGDWRVDENGMPIKVDLSMELANLEQPLQRNLWGDELDGRFPRDPQRPLPLEGGDIPGVERFSDPVNFRNDPENQRPLTEAIDSMDPVARAVALEQTQMGRELPASPEMEAAKMDTETASWLEANKRPPLEKTALGSKARKAAFARMGRAKGQGGGVTTDLFGRTPERSGKLHDVAEFLPYRFQVLESMPNKDVFTGEQLRSALNREGVSAQERHVLTTAWDIARDSTGAAPDGSLFVGKAKATEFVDALNSVTERYSLSKAPSEEYASYGLGRLGRDAGERWETIPRDEWTPDQLEEYLNYNVFPERKIQTEAGVTPTTNMWESPDSLSSGHTNHFDTANYVGHTRNFKEEGIRHVVEIQSDLLQKYKAPDTPESVTNKLTDEQLKQALEAAGERAVNSADTLEFNKNSAILRKLWAEEEAREKNRHTGTTQALQKNWPVRLIREELADAARNRETSVRFATADTMAKVEGWEDNHDFARRRLTGSEQGLKELEESRLVTSRLQGEATAAAKYDERIADVKADIQRLKDDLEAPRYDKQVQGIYDRYQKDVAKYLKSIGGKEVTDAQGHTWLEVPVDPSRKRPIMFGQRGAVLFDWKNDARDMDNALVRSADTSYIPENPDVADVLSKALSEGKDGKLWTYVQSGATSAAMKTGSAAIKAASEIVQNSLKRADLAIRNSVFPAEDSLRKLKGTEIDELSTLFKDEMFNGERYDGEILAKHLTVKQLEAYRNMRDLFDRTLDVQNEARLAKGQEPITPREAYLSSRWQGDFRRPIYDTEGKLVWYLAANSRMGLESQTKALLKEFPDLVVDKSKDKVVRSSSSKTDLQSAYSTMLDILGRDDPAVDKLRQAIQDQVIAESELTLAQRKHFKNKGNIRGFVGDRPGFGGPKESTAMFQQQIQYAKNAFKWAEMQTAGDSIKELVSSPELQKQQPNNVKYIREYYKNAIGMGESAVFKSIDDSIRSGLGVSPTEISRGVGNIKSLFIMQKLAASAGYTAANMVQTANVLPYLMNLRGQGYKGNPAVAIAVGVPAGMAMGVAHYMKAMGGDYISALPNQFFKDAFQYAEDNGVTARSVYDEAPLTTNSRALDATASAARFTMAFPETLVRSTAFMTYAQMLKDSGKFTDRSKLFQKAEELVNKSMVDYRESERALMFSKAGTAGNFLNTLQTYPMSFYNQWTYMAGEAMKGRPAGLATMLALQYAVAGASGLPGFDDMDKLYRWMRDEFVSTSTWNKMAKSEFFSDPKLWMMEHFGEASVYGALSDESGIGMTSRVAAPGMGAMLQSPAGPIMDLGKQAVNLGKAVMDPTNSTKWAQSAMSSIPVGLQGLLETAPFMKDHTYVERPDGTKVFMKTSDLADRKGGYARTPEEVGIRKWGVRSQAEVKARDVAYATSSANLSLTRRGGELIDQYYDAARKGDAKRALELRTLYKDITDKDISDTQMNNQMKEEFYTDIDRNMDKSNTPRQLLNAARMSKILQQGTP